VTLSTLIHAGLVRPEKERKALVLMGGGARTAYQAGVLKAIAEMLRASAQAQPNKFPFEILVGTSAGALNVSFLASRATQGLAACDALHDFWRGLRSHQVYDLHAPWWLMFSRWLTGWHLLRRAKSRGALLDNLPLADTLNKAISLVGIDDALEQGALHALAVTASSYSTGVHWSFVQAAAKSKLKAWSRPGRRAELQALTMDHLMASSAIPLLFPAQPLWVDAHGEYFGDGSMRQTSPLSPALHLGAHKVLVIGVGQPERGSLGEASLEPKTTKAGEYISKFATNSVANKYSPPGVGGVLGHALASVFHDTLRSDVEQAQRMNDTLQQLPREVAAVMPYRQVQVLSIQPSESLDALARQHAKQLSPALRRVLDSLAGGGSGSEAASGLASYLLFEPEFSQALIQMGQRDAYAQKNELMAFLSPH
jgi:NTE family protein